MDMGGSTGKSDTETWEEIFEGLYASGLREKRGRRKASPKNPSGQATRTYPGIDGKANHRTANN